MTEEKPTVVDSMRHTFEQYLAAYAAAEAALRATRPWPKTAMAAATAHRDAARRAVLRARPAGVTTLEVAQLLRDAAMAGHAAPQPAMVRL